MFLCGILFLSPHWIALFVPHNPSPIQSLVSTRFHSVQLNYFWKWWNTWNGKINVQMHIKFRSVITWTTTRGIGCTLAEPDADSLKKSCRFNHGAVNVTKPWSSLCSDKSSNNDSNLIKCLSPSVLSLEKKFCLTWPLSLHHILMVSVKKELLLYPSLISLERNGFFPWFFFFAFLLWHDHLSRIPFVLLCLALTLWLPKRINKGNSSKYTLDTSCNQPGISKLLSINSIKLIEEINAAPGYF